METITAVAFILLISFLLAARSMKDIHFSKEIEKSLRKKKIKGAIVFFKDRITHYS